MRRLLPPTLLLLGACAGRPEAPPPPPPPPPPPAPTAIPIPPPPPEAAPEPLELRGLAEGDGVRVELAVSLPALPAAARQRLGRAVAAGLLAGLDLPRGDLQAQAAHLRARLAGERAGSGRPWSVARRASAAWRGGGLLCLRLAIAEDLADGPQEAESALVVDLGSLRAQLLDDLVPPAVQALLGDDLLRRLRAQRGLPADAPLSRHGFLSDRPPLPVPFIGEAGLRFAWNPGDIAPREAGACAVELDREAARRYLAVDPWGSGR